MLKDERLKKILTLIEKEGMVKVNDIMDALKVSDMTVRRDLSELEKRGQIVRVHGGAKSTNFKYHEELSHSDKLIINKEDKKKVATYAQGLISEGDTIYLGPGTTMEILANLIKTKNIRVVTNCLPVFEALKLECSESKVYLLGGEMRKKTSSFFGEITNQSLQHFKFNKAFFSCNAVNDQSVMTSTIEEGQTQQIALSHADKKYLLIDSSKIGKDDFYSYYSTNEVTSIIISGDKIDDYDSLDKHNIMTLIE